MPLHTAAVQGTLVLAAAGQDSEAVVTAESGPSLRHGRRPGALHRRGESGRSVLGCHLGSNSPTAAGSQAPLPELEVGMLHQRPDWRRTRTDCTVQNAPQQGVQCCPPRYCSRYKSQIFSTKLTMLASRVASGQPRANAATNALIQGRDWCVLDRCLQLAHNCRHTC